MSDRDLEELRLMDAEWSAWAEGVVPELTRLGIDINRQDRLNAAICLWGVRLCALRRAQAPSDVAEWERKQTEQHTATLAAEAPLVRIPPTEREQRLTNALAAVMGLIRERGLSPALRDGTADVDALAEADRILAVAHRLVYEVRP